MKFIQHVPPPTPPPPPPGLPIDKGVVALLVIGVIYGILILKTNSVQSHLRFCPFCTSRKITRTKKGILFGFVPVLSKKYLCKRCEKKFTFLFFLKKKILYAIKK